MSPLQAAPGGPTSSQVKKAGSLVRKAMRGESMDRVDLLSQAIEIISAHRATFRSPLVSANNSLRYWVEKLDLDGQVSQRLKRMQTILDKMKREPTLALNRMHDIGGCRVVLPGRKDVSTLVEALRGMDRTLQVRDYIAEPRQSGYRGVHLIMEYGKCPRPIEVQVRTHAMHRWATTVEDISGNAGVNYKMDGASPMQVFLECYSRVLDCVDTGRDAPKPLLEEYETLLSKAFREELR
ncbi:hypothetical protein SAMN05443377_1304 [Propionibacterium cyclohexanicum]|uniref:RelA/SpoT domain-containing protein n=1 Tax=Propionibacterium cyclohexanicum TaxID=64702 RepID=A0A1H9TW31_9ACTN|nr:hypothetical protein SAMN05443377_1304 [Propionibacterium cyclohexanicum]